MDYRSPAKNEVSKGLAREFKLASIFSRTEVLSSNETASHSVNKTHRSILEKRGNANLIAGFTLIEVLIVLGMLAIFATMGLVFSFDSYRGYLFRSEYTTTVNLLAKARNRAINNFNESCHGVAILAGEYRIFRSATCDTDNIDSFESFPRNNALTLTGPEEIMFDQLTGNLAWCEGVVDEDDICSLTFGYGLKTKNVDINYYGGITW